MSLEGKIVIVTGSSRGIGFSTAKLFAEKHHCIVTLCSRDIKRSVRISKKIKGNVFPVQLDVTKKSEIKTVINAVISKYGTIDVLINNAGFPFDKNIWYKKFHKIDENDFLNILNVDLMGSVRMSQAVIPVMLKNRNGGVIINISSTTAVSGYHQGAAYTLAKSANIALTKHISREYGSNNIRSYTLALGNISTDATYFSMNEKQRKIAENESPMKRWGRPEEVSTVAASLASNDFSFATGNTILVDGGFVMI